MDLLSGRGGCLTGFSGGGGGDGRPGFSLSKRVPISFVLFLYCDHWKPFFLWRGVDVVEGVDVGGVDFD